MNRRNPLFGSAALIVVVLAARESLGQSFGAELHNTVMPASGGMGGASIARPQDPQSALNGNPASLTRLRGKQFSLSGAWIEPTYNITHTPPAGGALPGVGAFSAKSEAQGAAVGNIGVTQDVSELGLPLTVGVGLVVGAGGGLSFRQLPASNGTTAMFQALEIVSAAGMQLTERLSAGANLMLGNAILDGPFIGLTGASYDYALRGSLGINQDIGEHTTLGFYYQTKQPFEFDDAVRLQLFDGTFTAVTDIDLDLPDNIGLGIANERLLDGNLLLAVDVLLKQWDNADLFRAIYDNQWVFQCGAQYTWNERVRIRGGYVFAEDAMDPNPGVSAGGVAPPGALAAIQYVQAQFAAINRHRISIGVGIRDVMPGMDLDLLAGGMFRESRDFGPFTSASVVSYWLGGGITWRFGPGVADGLELTVQ